MKTDSITDVLKTFNKVIDEVLKYPPGPKRWRAAHDLLWLNISPTNRQQYAEVVRENAMQRELVTKHGEAIGVTKGEKSDKTFRQALAIPHGAYYAITRADPRAFNEKKNGPLMFKEFKEYTTRSTY